ncbi:MAG: polyprenyl synthetase family protein, partial [Thermomicrobiales bacterium]
LGKPAGHDLIQGTVTLPTLIYAAGLDENSAEMGQLTAVVSGEVDDRASVDRVVADIRQSGALEESLLEAERFAERARERIRGIPDPETRDMLSEVADIVCDRSA